MPRPLRIGVNALQSTPGRTGGMETYLHNILPALAKIDNRNIYTVFTNNKTDANLCPKKENFRVSQSTFLGKTCFGRFFLEQIILPIQVLQTHIDVILTPSFSMPIVSTVRKVTLIDDLRHKLLPESFSRLELSIRKFTAWNATKASNRLITPTNQTKEDLVREYSIPRKKVAIVRYGAEEDFFNLKKNPGYNETLLGKVKIPDQPYLLVISAPHPHKNLERLFDAYKELVATGITEHLVISGPHNKSWRAIRNYIRKIGLEQRIHLFGWLPRRTLLALFKYAEALVLPSISEGSSISLIEAMAAELPIACSDIPAFRETVLDAAVFFDPFSVHSIAQSVSQVVDDTALRNQLVDRSEAQANGLTWRATAEKTLAVLLETGRR